MGFGPDGRTLTVDGLTLVQIIREAYGVLPDELSVRPSAATGGWIDSQKFDISAKSEGHGPVDKEHSTLMLRQLLTDRFGLILHRETKELVVYSLVAGKNGPKLKEGVTGTPYLNGPAPGRLVGTRASMASLTRALSRSLGRPVNDETGLNGQYDFTLLWTPDDTNSPAALADATGPSLFTALQDQLGLKLESKKAPVETIVIDHIATPSPN
jgi:uncharacterized protein (TIGR03435 family)